MKNLFKQLMFTGLLGVTLIFNSCQSEFEELPQPNEPQTIVASSSTAKLIERTSSNDGSFDDIVDGARCFAIQFPYTVNLNGIEITLNSREDLGQIREALKQISSDLLEIVFPITITLGDFSEITINGVEGFRELVKECDDDDNEDDDHIKCIDFVYPLTLFTFDINNQQTGNVAVNSDMELRRFFSGLDDNDLISIEFPVSLTLSDSTTVTVNTNAELANIIENAKDDCSDDIDDEGDDDGDGVVSLERLRNVLAECSWVIKKVKNQGEELDRLLGFEFNFEAEGVVTLSDGETTSEGTWEIAANAEGRLVMSITMGDEPGVSFEWPLSDLKDNRLKFEVPGTGYELILERVCNDNSGDGDVPEIRNIMMGGDWVVAQYKDNGMDETANYTGFDFSFTTDHRIVVSTNADPVQRGLWRVLRDSDGKLKAYLNLGVEDPFGEFTDDWDIVSVTANRIELKDISGGDGSIDTLVFEKP